MTTHKIDEIDYYNKNIAFNTYDYYVEQVRNCLCKRLKKRLKQEKMFAKVELYQFPVMITIEFTTVRKLYSEINFEPHKNWEFTASLFLTDAEVKSSFESDQYYPDDSREYIIDPDKQAARMENQYMEYIKDYWYLAKRVSVKGI